MNKLNTKILRLPLILFITLFCFPFFWFSNTQFIAGGETMTLLNGHTSFELLQYTWNEGFGFGLPNIHFTSILYLFIVKAFNSFFTISIVHKILFGLALSLSFVSFYQFARYYFKDRNNSPIYAAAALFYTVNPFTIMMFPWFPTYSIFFILTPFIALCMMKYYEKSNLIYLIPLGLLSALVVNLSLLILLLALVSLLILLNFFRSKDFFKKTLIAGIAFILLNLYWILPFLQIYRSLFSEAVIYSTTFIRSISVDNPILQNLTLNGYYWFDKQSSPGEYFYLYAPYYKPLGIFIVTIIVISILHLAFVHNRNVTTQKSGSFYSLFALLLVGAFLSKGTSPPFGILYELALKHVPLFGIYRSPDIKFQYIVLFSLSLLFVLVLSHYKKILKSKNYKFVIAITYVALTLLSLPVITGQIFHPKSKVTLPDYWQQTAKYVNNEQTINRILQLPSNESPFDKYPWGYEGGWLISILTNKPVIGFIEGYGPSRHEHRFKEIDNAIQKLDSNNSQLVREALKKYGVSHILYRRDLEQNVDAANDIALLNRLFPNKMEFGKLLLYTVDDTISDFDSNGFDLKINKIDPTKYILEIQNATTSGELIFKQSFDDNWKIFPLNQEYDSISQLSLVDYILLFFKQPLFQSQHEIHEDYSNKWEIPLNELNQNDSDNGRNNTLLLVFMPQIYYMLGILISVITVICIGIFQFKHKNTHGQN